MSTPGPELLISRCTASFVERIGSALGKSGSPTVARNAAVLAESNATQAAASQALDSSRCEKETQEFAAHANPEK